MDYTIKENFTAREYYDLLKRHQYVTSNRDIATVEKDYKMIKSLISDIERNINLSDIARSMLISIIIGYQLEVTELREEIYENTIYFWINNVINVKDVLEDSERWDLIDEFLCVVKDIEYTFYNDESLEKAVDYATGKLTRWLVKNGYAFNTEYSVKMSSLIYYDDLIALAIEECIYVYEKNTQGLHGIGKLIDSIFGEKPKE